jgi:tRNA pseudouridine55 synthase
MNILSNFPYIWWVNKPLGVTNGQAIKLLRGKVPELRKRSLSYAGRLDPMACGVLPIVDGKDTVAREQVLKLNKTYVVEFLLGIRSDSGDALGMAELAPRSRDFTELDEMVQKVKEMSRLPAPLYSSIPYQGKPLWWWAKNGLLPDVLPETKCRVEKINLREQGSIRLHHIVDLIVPCIRALKGDFRQNEIISRWRELDASAPTLELEKITLEIECGSGTYVRAIVPWIGEQLRTRALVYSLVRTRVGKVSLKECLTLITRKRDTPTVR